MIERMRDYFMKAKELWSQFVGAHPEHENARYEAWSFGVDPDELAELTLQGIKTTTTSGHELYEIDNEALPTENEFNVILDGSDHATCITKTTKVYVTPFNEVSEQHAFKEGEGDRTLAYWRRVHTDFFLEEYGKNNLVFDEEALVVCEEFEVVHKAEKDS